MDEDTSAGQAWAVATFTSDQLLVAMTKGFLRAATEMPAGREEVVATLRAMGYTVTPPQEDPS
jgi:hypothetical protein